MSEKRKKVIRLTETEMVDLIERIVNEVKTTKRKAIQENRRKSTKPSRKVARRK